MAQAAFDQNSRTSLLGVSRIDYLDPTKVAADPTYHWLAVGILDGSGNQITSFGGGTQYPNGDTVATPTGTVAMGFDGTDVYALAVDSSGQLQIDVLSIPGIVGTVADDGATPGNPVMVGGFAKSPDGTSPGNVSAEDDVARFITDLNRRQYVNTRSPQWWSFHSDGSSALTDQTVQADPGDGFEIVITEIIFSTGAATACNIFFEEGSTKILGPWYLEAVAGRGVVWRGEKHVTASTAVTVTTSAAIAQSLDVQGYIQKV